jgi:phosphoglycerol transferase
MHSGAMMGRGADRFYRELSSKPTMADQIRAIKKLGFAVIYVDRRGYADNGAAIVAELTAPTGAPTVAQAPGPKVFFDLGK